VFLKLACCNERFYVICYMAHCSYITLFHNTDCKPCGVHDDYPFELAYMLLQDCTKDVSSHLGPWHLSGDEGANTEM